MRNAVWLTLVSMLIVAAAVLVVPSVASPLRAEAIVAAVVICVTAGWLAMLPPVLVFERRPDYLLGAGMAMILIRLFVTLVVGWAYLRWTEPDYWTYVTAMVVCYFTLLAVETGATMYMARRLWKLPVQRVS
jgi:hypothetical protein